jgi:hypothetical protein
MRLYKIPVIGRALRLHHVHLLVDEFQELEAAMRDTGARLIELSDPGDELAAAVQKILTALEG